MSRILTTTLLALAVAACGAASGSESEGQVDQGVSATRHVGPDPAGRPARYPIVLVHGFGGSASVYGFDPAIVRALESDAHRVIVAELPPYQASAVRAQVLARTVESALRDSGQRKVHIVAHSMGGLDSRIVAATGHGGVIDSLTTISTPHRGSPLADMILGALDDGDAVATSLGVDATWLRDRLTEYYGGAFGLDVHDPDLRSALRDISTANAPRFNATYADDARVRYASVAGVSTILGVSNGPDRAACGASFFEARRDPRAKEYLLGYPAAGGWPDIARPALSVGVNLLYGRTNASNDGLVTVQSARWGTFLGCIPADHGDEIGQGAIAVNGWSSFDVVRFYRVLAFDIARAER
jgi:triacylglycerol lipase